MSTQKTALVFGATGLVGQQLINLLIEDERYNKVYIANRTTRNYNNQKIEEHLIDYSQLKLCGDLFKADHVFICLGTTIKKAGSKKEFEKVDFEYPVEIAQMAKVQGVRTLVHISALGANPNASNFYLKTKGKTEELIWEKGPLNSYAVRPSMLFGDRKEFRLGEKIGIFLMQNLEFLMQGFLKKYRGIYDIEVAEAMIFIANSLPKQNYIDSEELKAIATRNLNQ